MFGCVVHLWLLLFDLCSELVQVPYLPYLLLLCDVITGESREDVWLNKYFGGWKGSEGVGKRVMVGVDQSSFSDANSEVSVSESGVTNRSNLSISEEKESETMDDKINNMSFIDFLGVGAT